MIKRLLWSLFAVAVAGLLVPLLLASKESHPLSIALRGYRIDADLDIKELSRLAGKEDNALLLFFRIPELADRIARRTQTQTPQEQAEAYLPKLQTKPPLFRLWSENLAETSAYKQIVEETDGVLVLTGEASAPSTMELWEDSHLLASVKTDRSGQFVIGSAVWRGRSSWILRAIPLNDLSGRSSKVELRVVRPKTEPLIDRRLDITFGGNAAIVKATVRLPAGTTPSASIIAKMWKADQVFRQFFPPIKAQDAPLWQTFDKSESFASTDGNTVTWSSISRTIALEPDFGDRDLSRFEPHPLGFDLAIDREQKDPRPDQWGSLDVYLHGWSLSTNSITPEPKSLAEDSAYPGNLKPMIAHMILAGAPGQDEMTFQADRATNHIERFQTIKEGVDDLSRRPTFLALLINVLRTIVSILPLYLGVAFLANFKAQKRDGKLVQDSASKAMQWLLATALAGPLLQMTFASYYRGTTIFGMIDYLFGGSLKEALTAGGPVLGIPLLVGMFIEVLVIHLGWLLSWAIPCFRRKSWLNDIFSAMSRATLLVAAIALILCAANQFSITFISTPVELWPWVCYAVLIGIQAWWFAACLADVSRWWRAVAFVGLLAVWLLPALVPTPAPPMEGGSNDTFWATLKRTADLALAARSIALILMAGPALRYLYFGGKQRSSQGFLRLVPLGLVLMATFAVAGARPLAAIPVDFLVAIMLGISMLKRSRREVEAIKAIAPHVQEHRSSYIDRALRAFQAIRFRRSLDACEKKLTGGEMSLGDFNSWTSEIAEYDKKAVRVDDVGNGLHARDLALGISVKRNPWLSGLHAVGAGSLLALPMLFLYLVTLIEQGTPQALPGSVDPYLRIVVAAFALFMQWTGGAFVFGYYFDRIKGNSGLKKGVRVGLVVATSATLFLLLDQPGQISVWTVLLQFSTATLFYAALGVIAFDRLALRSLGGSDSAWNVYARISGMARLAGVTSILLSAAIAGITTVVTKQVGDALDTLTSTVVAKGNSSISLTRDEGKKASGEAVANEPKLLP